MEQWYAVHTRPRREQQVRVWLESRGLETYLPVHVVSDMRHPQQEREEPFFARYLFAHLDSEIVPISSVNWLPGVSQVVSFGGEPAVVPDGVIRWLKERLAQAAMGEYYKGVPWRPNDRVRVTAGPLRGMEAIFDRRLSATARARVFIKLLGRLTACEVPLAWLERV